MATIEAEALMTPMTTMSRETIPMVTTPMVTMLIEMKVVMTTH